MNMLRYYRNVTLLLIWENFEWPFLTAPPSLHALLMLNWTAHCSSRFQACSAPFSAPLTCSGFMYNQADLRGQEGRRSREGSVWVGVKRPGGTQLGPANMTPWVTELAARWRKLSPTAACQSVRRRHARASVRILWFRRSGSRPALAGRPEAVSTADSTDRSSTNRRR